MDPIQVDYNGVAELLLILSSQEVRSPQLLFNLMKFQHNF